MEPGLSGKDRRRRALPRKDLWTVAVFCGKEKIRLLVDDPDAAGELLPSVAQTIRREGAAALPGLRAESERRLQAYRVATGRS